MSFKVSIIIALSALPSLQNLRKFNKNIIVSINFTRIDFMLGKMQITLIVLNF
jgi:hypothetical protein